MRRALIMKMSDIASLDHIIEFSWWERQFHDECCRWYVAELAIAHASEESLWTQLAQAVMLPAVGGVCHVWMHGLNITEVYGAEKLHKVINNRPGGQSLITVCNHVASMDDPLVMAALLPPRLFLQPKSLRWTLCATDRCFTNAAFSAFFHSVKVLPLKRGAGLQQEGIDIALSKLKRGDWVHIFPEGSRSRDGGKTIGTVRRGIGRLVTDVERTPLVVPFVHVGMQDLMPIGSKFPAVKKKVSVLIGDPIDLDDLVKESSMKFGSKGELYDAIAFRVGQRLKVMKEELDQLVAVREIQLGGEEAEKLHSLERAQELLQYVDWESQGVLPQSDSSVREHILDVSSTRNTTSDAQISEARKQSSTEEQTNMSVELITSEQKISEAEMEEFFELDDWDPISKPSILSRVRGFVDTPSFLGLGFAARGLLSDTTEHTRSELRGWKYWRRFSTKPLTRVDRAERFSDFCH
ncbi:uncharacterized protein [Physcomitrium patens]|uniref:Tafazzin family protein n=1 Tax=Physcomitrium patens TaxID=3218 RepID=A0A7I4F253_PHYPA|nr:tafazzin-like isoform X2 [Physcomitrium patens]|eukprot:XP_024391263.1 tafazzin-like isoform X2 [Physcomitrella patens]